MPVTLDLTPEALARLSQFLAANHSVDWRTFAFGQADAIGALSWQNEGDEAQLIPLLKAHQRVLRLLPEAQEGRAVPLIAAGFHSAVRIANVPRVEFAARWAREFSDEAELGELVHRNAVARRSQVALEYIHNVQSNEPHYRAARFR
jgi:hypothetical protein